jgi:hypothetical protein
MGSDLDSLTALFYAVLRQKRVLGNRNVAGWGKGLSIALKRLDVRENRATGMKRYSARVLIVGCRAAV